MERKHDYVGGKVTGLNVPERDFLCVMGDGDDDDDEEVFVEANDSRDDQLSATELRKRHNIHNQEHEDAADVDYLNTMLGIAVQQNYYTLETKNRDDADGRHPLQEEEHEEEEEEDDDEAAAYRNS